VGILTLEIPRRGMNGGRACNFNRNRSRWAERGQRGSRGAGNCQMGFRRLFVANALYDGLQTGGDDHETHYCRRGIGDEHRKF
jgi:hypothetical protein